MMDIIVKFCAIVLIVVSAMFFFWYPYLAFRKCDTWGGYFRGYFQAFLISAPVVVLCGRALRWW
jgi:amino acid permease